MIYQYRWKAYQYPVPAEKAGEFITELEQQNGCVTPQTLLDAARPTESVIHPCYEWDDTKAAEKYRLQQSRDIIHNIVRVEVTEDGTSKNAIPILVNVSESRCDRSTYISLDTALSDSTMRNNVLRKAKEELSLFKSKYATLNELAKVFEAIDEVNKEGGN